MRCKCGKKAAPNNPKCWDCDPQAAAQHEASPVCNCGKPKPPGDWMCASCIAEGEARTERQQSPDRQHEEY